MVQHRKRILSLILASVLSITLLSGCSATEAISVIADLEITFSGADGYGIAEIENAYDWIDALNLDTDNDGENDSTVESEVRSAVTYELDQTEGLSNGDTVTLTVTVNNGILANYGYSASDFTNTYTVSGLVDGETVDIFEGVTLDCSGIAPYGTATVNKGTEDYGFTISYSMDKSNGLSNGDTVLVTAEYAESSALKAGVFVESNTQEFTVSGLQVYLSEGQRFPTETLERMQGEVEDGIHIRMEADEGIWRDWASTVDEENQERWTDTDHTSFNDITCEYVGMILQSPVNDSEATYHNLLNVLYRVNIRATYQNGDNEAELNSTIYLSYYYTNVIMEGDGDSALDTSDIFYTEDAIYESAEALNAAIAEDADYSCSEVEAASLAEIQAANNPEPVEEETESGLAADNTDPSTTEDTTSASETEAPQGASEVIDNTTEETAEGSTPPAETEQTAEPEEPATNSGNSETTGEAENTATEGNTDSAEGQTS